MATRQFWSTSRPRAYSRVPQLSPPRCAHARRRRRLLSALGATKCAAPSELTFPGGRRDRAARKARSQRGRRTLPSRLCASLQLPLCSTGEQRGSSLGGGSSPLQPRLHFFNTARYASGIWGALQSLNGSTAADALRPEEAWLRTGKTSGCPGNATHHGA